MRNGENICSYTGKITALAHDGVAEEAQRAVGRVQCEESSRVPV